VASVALVFSDGERASIDAKDDEPILAAARRQGFDLAYGCEMGGCQTCQGHLDVGAVTYDDGVSPALTEAEIAAGAVLCCVGVPTSDVVVRLPYTRASLLPSRTWSLRLTEISRIAETTVMVRGRIAGGAFTFYPGQFVNLRVPGSSETRSYSMSSAPERSGEPLEFLVRVLEGGVMSRYVTERAAVGDEIELKGPSGVFYLRDGPSPAYMVAGGTGVAPILAMLRSMVHRGRTDRPVTVCFGVNRVSDLICVEELRSLAGCLERMDLRIAVGQSDPAWSGPVGLVTGLLNGLDPSRDRGEAYLCGPPPMVAAARARFLACGFDASSIHHEQFAPSGMASQGDGERAA
jgi:NAD(P)H-flavin reductase/ferredoxin